MPKLKYVFVFFVMVALALQLTGCSLLFSRGSDPERETAVQEAGMPSWLLLSHRSIEDPDLADSDDLPESPGNGETEDPDGSINVEPSGPSTGSPPAATQPSGGSATPEQANNDNDIKPGTMEWLDEMKKQEKAAQEAWEKEKAAEEEAAKEEDIDETEEKKWYDMDKNNDNGISHDTNIITD